MGAKIAQGNVVSCKYVAANFVSPGAVWLWDWDGFYFLLIIAGVTSILTAGLSLLALTALCLGIATVSALRSSLGDWWSGWHGYPEGVLRPARLEVTFRDAKSRRLRLFTIKEEELGAGQKLGGEDNPGNVCIAVVSCSTYSWFLLYHQLPDKHLRDDCATPQYWFLSHKDISSQERSDLEFRQSIWDLMLSCPESVAHQWQTDQDKALKLRGVEKLRQRELDQQLQRDREIADRNSNARNALWRMKSQQADYPFKSYVCGKGSFKVQETDDGLFTVLTLRSFDKHNLIATERVSRAREMPYSDDGDPFAFLYGESFVGQDRNSSRPLAIINLSTGDLWSRPQPLDGSIPARYYDEALRQNLPAYLLKIKEAYDKAWQPGGIVEERYGGL